MFRMHLTNKEIVAKLIGYSQELRKHYELYQLLLFHFQEKQDDQFFGLIEETISSVNPVFQTVFRTFLMDRDKIVNALKLPFSNAKLEATNYRQLDNAQLVGCWAHVRRKFFDATPKKTDKTSLGAKGLAYCDRLFALESDWADLSSEERLHKRQTELAPLMDEFFDWCRNQAVLPGSKLGTALEYSLKYETTFRTVLSDGDLVLSNNREGNEDLGYGP